MKSVVKKEAVHPEQPSPDFARQALLAERARIAPRVNLLRARAVGVGIAVMAAQDVLRSSNWVGPSFGLMIAWFIAAVALYLLTRTPASRARASLLFVPIVDLPALYILFQQMVAALAATNRPEDAPATAVLSTILFGLLIFISSGLVERWQILVTTAIAITLQLALNLQSGVDSTVSTTTIMSLVFAAVATITAGDRILALVSSAVEQQRQRERLNRYFSPQVSAHLEAQGDHRADTQEVEATVLFVDIRGFTKLAEALPAREVVAQLNEFHEATVAVVFAHGGTLDKYLGDGLMAYFGAPLPSTDHARQAVACARDLLAAVASLNGTRAQRSLPPMEIGIGIHTGKLLVGDVGARSRKEFTAIGHTVNVAARLEQATKAHSQSILLSEATATASNAQCSKVGTIEVQGVAEPLTVFAPA